MPTLPIISGMDFRRAIERDGWVCVRQKGSHMAMRNPETGVTFPVPDHKELDRGTLKSMLNQAGYTVDDLLQLLER